MGFGELLVVRVLWLGGEGGLYFPASPKRRQIYLTVVLFISNSALNSP